MPPFTMPELPIPAIARPPINIGDDVATAQIREPSSKIVKNTRYDHFHLLV